MKNLIKQQDEEFNKEFSNIAIIESWGMELCKCGKEPCECKNIVLDFISKVRKKTAEYVCDKMIGEKLKESIDEEYNTGYNVRIEKEKAIKQSILQEL